MLSPKEADPPIFLRRTAHRTRASGEKLTTATTATATTPRLRRTNQILIVLVGDVDAAPGIAIAHFAATFCFS